MLSPETIRSLATRLHTSDYPNAVREYGQHLFLAELYKQEAAHHLLFKGGTALRIVFGSPRFSEDLDFSLFGVSPHERQRLIEDLFQNALVGLANIGLQVAVGEKFGPTRDGYYGLAEVTVTGYPAASIEINISTRSGPKVRGEPALIANDFISSYTLQHLPQAALIEEKIFGALLNRHKARDFFDLYWLMRRGLLTIDQKHRLASAKRRILELSSGISYQAELGALLPSDQHNIIRDFPATLASELQRQAL